MQYACESCSTVFLTEETLTCFLEQQCQRLDSVLDLVHANWAISDVFDGWWSIGVDMDDIQGLSWLPQLINGKLDTFFVALLMWTLHQSDYLFASFEWCGPWTAATVVNCSHMMLDRFVHSSTYCNCIVTRGGVYDEILPELEGFPDVLGNISSYILTRVTIQPFSITSTNQYFLVLTPWACNIFSYSPREQVNIFPYSPFEDSAMAALKVH